MKGSRFLYRNDLGFQSSSGRMLAVVFLGILVMASSTACALIPPSFGRQSASQPVNILTGEVVDAVVGQGISDVRIEARRDRSLVSSVLTDGHGAFRIEILGAFRCALYFLPLGRGNTGSPAQYGPATREIVLEGNTVENLTIRLLPVASMMLRGDIDLVDLDASPTIINFTVIDALSGRPVEADGFLNRYGSQTMFLGFNQNLALIPIGYIVRVRVDCGRMIMGRFGWVNTTRSFYIDGIPEAQRGSIIEVDVAKYTSSYNLQVTESLSERLREKLREAEQTGFYVVAEKNDLSSINKLIVMGKENKDSSQYEQGFAKLREAYFRALRLGERIDVVFSEAYWSAIFFVFFLALSGIVVGLFLFERMWLKLAGFAISYVALLSWFYVVFPGCRLVAVEAFLGNGLAVGAVAVFSLISLPLALTRVRGRLLPNIVLFSIAKRSLRRRKLRTTLVMTTMITLMVGFVALTSFSIEYGFQSGTRNVSASSLGILIREANPQGGEFSPFASLDATNLPWLGRREGVTTLAPKMESPPQLRLVEDAGIPSRQTRSELGTLTKLSGEKGSMAFLGLIGISPSAEPRVTHLDDLIVEGSFLKEQEQEGVIISRRAAQLSGLGVGDRLMLSVSGYLTSTVLTGLLDDAKLNERLDLDGEPIRPRIRYVRVDKGEVLRDELIFCDPAEMVIVTFSLARMLPGMIISRVCLSLSDPLHLQDLARELVYARDYWVWVATANEVQWMKLGTYVETKGWMLAVPLILVVLNMSATMFTVVHERQKEILTLSSLGVSPSSIAQLFLAEALVIALVGVGIGHLAGLSFYRVLPVFSVGLEVREKVEVGWSIVAAAIAVAVCLVGTFLPSKQASLFSTPLGISRWKLTKQTAPHESPATGPRLDEQWSIPIPIRIQTGEADQFLLYVQERFSKMNDPDSDHIEKMTRKDEKVGGQSVKRLEFRHVFRDSVSFGFFTSRCALTVHEGIQGYLDVELSVGGSVERQPLVYITADLMRKLALEWSTRRT